MVRLTGAARFWFLLLPGWLALLMPRVEFGLLRMSAQYSEKRDNPWELLAIASWFFGPGLALLLYNGPPLLLKHGHRTPPLRVFATVGEVYIVGASRISFTPLEVHIVGGCALTVAGLLLALYVYTGKHHAHAPINTSFMTTIAGCFDIAAARRLQIALWAADIPSFIPDEATAYNAPYIFIGTQAGVRLQVTEEDMPEAEQIIIDSWKAQPEEKSNKVGETRPDPDEGEVRF